MRVLYNTSKLYIAVLNLAPLPLVGHFLSSQHSSLHLPQQGTTHTDSYHY